MGKPSPTHKPTDATRAQVSALTSFGNTQEQIAAYLRIDADTLAKHYRYELDNATLIANERVAGVLFSKCIDDRDTTSILFWLKTRGRWRENHEDKSKKDSLIEKLVEKLVTE